MGMDQHDTVGRNEVRGVSKRASKNAFDKLSFLFKIDGKSCKMYFDENGDAFVDCPDEVGEKAQSCIRLLGDYLESAEGAGIDGYEAVVFLRKATRMCIKLEKITRERRFKKLWSMDIDLGPEVDLG